MAESSVNENTGFVILQEDDQAQAAPAAAAPQSAQTQQTAPLAHAVQEIGIPTIHEETGSRDLAIGGGIIVVLLLAFFFAKQAYTNSLVKKRVSPGKASMAGWWLFIMLSSIAIAAVLAAVNPAKFLSALIVGPLGVVALISAFLTIKSSQA